MLQKCFTWVMNRCRECARDEGMVRLVPDIEGADPGAAGLLIECRGQTPECLKVSNPIPLFTRSPYMQDCPAFLYRRCRPCPTKGGCSEGQWKIHGSASLFASVNAGALDVFF